MDPKKKKVVAIVVACVVGLGLLVGLHNHHKLDKIEEKVGISHHDHK
jgi:hypothetical protein